MNVVKILQGWLQMSDQPAQSAVSPQQARVPFPGTRLLHAIFYAVIAWFTFWVVLVLAALQFLVLVFHGRMNEELRNFTRTLAQYMWELLSYIAFARDDKPFPIGPFPK
ncbi:MAG: hypothetical protein BGO00_10125 [Alphaproteobacteria bacterium 62-8]|jgi:hypothetical protein|nr:MAG: hypothetical protein BGO00_10125 [Alphaproteobacteria bacterium 62-8]